MIVCVKGDIHVATSLLRKLWAGCGAEYLHAALARVQCVALAGCGWRGGKCMSARFATLACSFPRLLVVAGAASRTR
ncbi:MAG: hypothetical protein Ta2A_00240 [Treponemataceae bacterium]|nr:MAG: hypothetical protein Ta2A_00240 [Treponemataceae bacterium]